VTDLQSLWPKSTVKVVAVTADAFEDRWEQCIAAGFDGWLAKPCTVEDMCQILKALLCLKLSVM